MFRRRFSRSILWAVIILVLCTIPGKDIPEPDFLRWLKADKLTHIFLFGTLAYLLLLDASSIPGKKLTFILIVITIAYGGLIELLQSIPIVQRDSDIRDAAANAIGAIFGWWLYRKRNPVTGFKT